MCTRIYFLHRYINFEIKINVIKMEKIVEKFYNKLGEGEIEGKQPKIFFLFELNPKIMYIIPKSDPTSKRW